MAKRGNKKIVGFALDNQELMLLEELKEKLGMTSSTVARLALKSLYWAYYNDKLGNTLTLDLNALKGNVEPLKEEEENEKK